MGREETPLPDTGSAGPNSGGYQRGVSGTMHDSAQNIAEARPLPLLGWKEFLVWTCTRESFPGRDSAVDSSLDNDGLFRFLGGEWIVLGPIMEVGC